MCSMSVKIQLFNTYGSPMYTAQLWWNHTVASFHRLNVAYNNILRRLLRRPRFCSASGLFPSKHSTSGPHKAHMWQLKWLPPNGTHVGHTFFATVAHVWPTCDRCLAHTWPTYGRQEAHMWQTTGPHVAISRYINGKKQVNQCMAFNGYRRGPCVAIVLAYNRPIIICGNEQVQKWQSRCAYMAVNRHRSGPCVAVVQAYKRRIHGNQLAHTWQSTGTHMAIKNILLIS